jgi:glycosyltransferase involved in cell wall biosynthesis
MTELALFFTDSGGFGGAEKVLLTLLAGLDRQCWRPVLIHHLAPGVAPLLEEARRLDVTLWQVPRMPEGREGAQRALWFARQLAARRPAVFHAHLTWPRACKFGLAAAILAGVPAVVATLHAFIDLPASRYLYLQQWLLAKKVGRYLAVSAALARQMCATNAMPAHKIQVIHNGISMAPFQRPIASGFRLALSGTSGRPIVFTAARLDKQKGLGHLLEAAALVPEALFVLAGEGPERRALETQSQQMGLGDRVVLLGQREDIPDLLAASDLFALPSLNESLGVSILEAMAASRPVVATAIGGIGEAVADGETGLLVPPGDPVALAGAIRRLLSDPSLALRMGAAGKVRVQRDFSAETMLRRVTEVYDELLRRA